MAVKLVFPMVAVMDNWKVVLKVHLKASWKAVTKAGTKAVKMVRIYT